MLELGPLEGAHTFQLERLGARVLAVEANTEAFLKCLVVKELLELRSRFLCGDVLEFLEHSDSRYDLIFASGVLYHMTDPVRLIRLISTHSDKCFLWTHYHNGNRGKFRARAYSGHGFHTTLHELHYGYTGSGKFWGGNRPTAAWMQRDEIIRAFRFFGMRHHAVLGEDQDHPAGPAFSVGFWR